MYAHLLQHLGKGHDACQRHGLVINADGLRLGLILNVGVLGEIRGVGDIRHVGFIRGVRGVGDIRHIGFIRGIRSIGGVRHVRGIGDIGSVGRFRHVGDDLFPLGYQDERPGNSCGLQINLRVVRHTPTDKGVTLADRLLTILVEGDGIFVLDFVRLVRKHSAISAVGVGHIEIPVMGGLQRKRTFVGLIDRM